MGNKTLALVTFLISSSLAAQSLDHQAVQQNAPVPDGWVPAPKLVLDNTKNLPIVFVEQGHLTTLTFPKEMEWCSQKNNLFSHRIKGRKNSPDGDDSTGNPFTEIDVFTLPEGVQAVAEELKAYGKDIYSAEPGNMNCRFTSGEIAIIMLKIAPRPYMSVEFILPGARRDYSAFAGLGPEAKPVKGLQKVPLEPSNDPYFTMPAPSEPAVASETKRDWNTFRSAFGKGK